MKALGHFSLRTQLVFSHMAAVLAASALFAGGLAYLLWEHARKAELRALEFAAEASAGSLAQTLAQGELAARRAAQSLIRKSQFTLSVPELLWLNQLRTSLQVDRLELFSHGKLQAESFGWTTGAGADVATSWFPPHPKVAALLAAGQPASWLQAHPGGRPAVKWAIPLVEGKPEQYVVVTWVADAARLTAHCLPSASCSLNVGQTALLGFSPSPVAWDNLWFRWKLLKPVSARRALRQLDDGVELFLTVTALPYASAQALTRAVRGGVLILLSSLTWAYLLSTGIASRLLAPMKDLLEGTAAMARGHLMVRLPTQRRDELGSLTREFNRMADEIRATYLGVISTLAEVVEAKSHYTREHIERVERLTMATAEVLEKRGWVRFSSHQRFLLSVAAILHDVGKIAIGNEILNKAGPLSPEERKEILSHPEIGALIVERMGKLERAAEIIRCAHEHFDGSGYPRGLKGEEIPIESRIILAVDSFDAMTQTRPYSQGRSLEAAIAELRAEAGRQFDPVVVEALIEVVTREAMERRSATPSSSGLYCVLRGDSEPQPALNYQGFPTAEEWESPDA